MKLEDLKSTYKNEWLAIEVSKREKGIPIEGKLITHNPTKSILHADLRKRKIKDVFVVYSGPIIPLGYEAVF